MYWKPERRKCQKVQVVMVCLEVQTCGFAHFVSQNLHRSLFAEDHCLMIYCFLPYTTIVEKLFPHACIFHFYLPTASGTGLKSVKNLKTTLVQICRLQMKHLSFLNTTRRRLFLVEKIFFRNKIPKN